LKRRSSLITILFLFLFIPVAITQSIVISGTIRDAHTQEPISYASVYLRTAGNGKMSDSSGSFSFHLNNLTTDTLIVSFVGYEIFKIPVSQLNDSMALDIQLIRGGANADVVVRSNINKGLFLWRKIMAKKKLYDRYNMTNFGYEAYNKLEIDIKNFNADRVKKNIFLKPFSFIIQPLAAVSDTAGSLPAYLIESVSDYAYQRNPKRFYENIKASNTRGFIDESISKLLGVMNQNVDIYSNYVTVKNNNYQHCH